MSEKLIIINDDLMSYITLQEPLFGGIHIEFSFPNGYGASVVNHQFSYGLELAVLNSDGHITYDTTITNDVLGDLNPETLHEALMQIKKL